MTDSAQAGNENSGTERCWLCDGSGKRGPQDATCYMCDGDGRIEASATNSKTDTN